MNINTKLIINTTMVITIMVIIIIVIITNLDYGHYKKEHKDHVSEIQVKLFQTKMLYSSLHISFLKIFQAFAGLGPSRPSASGPRMGRRVVTSPGAVNISRLALRGNCCILTVLFLNTFQRRMKLAI